MGFITWIVVGLVAGFLASLIMRGSAGMARMLVLGVFGAVVGGYLATSVLHVGTVDGVNIESIAFATGGAMVMVLLTSLLMTPSSLRRASRSGR